MNGAFHYVVAGRTLECDVAFPELSDCPSGSGQEPAIHVAIARPHAALPRSVSWSSPRETLEDASEPLLRTGTCDDGYVLEYPGVGHFVVSAAGDRVSCRPMPGLSTAQARHALLDMVLPLVLSLSGDVVLHAGAVAVGNCGLALVGPSGRGKSTMVTYLGTRDAEALTDDCLVLRRQGGEWHAAPYYKGLRLWPESLLELIPDLATQRGPDAEKQRVRGTESLRFRTTAVPLRMIAILAEEAVDGAASTLRRLPCRQAFFSLLSETFSLELKAAAALRNQFNLIGQLADEVPVYEFSFPRQFARLPCAGAAVLSVLSQAGATA